MTENRMKDWFRKYHAGQISKEEFRQLRDAVNKTGDEELKELLQAHWDKYDGFATQNETSACWQPEEVLLASDGGGFPADNSYGIFHRFLLTTKRDGATFRSVGYDTFR